MSIWFMSSCLIISSMTLILSTNPFSTAVIILLVALLVSTLYALMLSSWFAFLVFLIYVGGMLVMFSYFVALTPNMPSLKMNKNLPIMTLSTILILTLTSMQMNTQTMVFQSFSVESWYQQSNTPLLLVLALTLLLTMIIVVKITRRSKGPLRAFMS